MCRKISSLKNFFSWLEMIYMEKNMAIRYHDSRFNMQSSYHEGLKQFLDEKSYRPVYESFEPVPQITDQREEAD